MRLLFLLMAGIVLLVPVPTAWGALVYESSFEDGVLSTSWSSDERSERVSFGMYGRMPPNCDGCPDGWSSVRRWNITSDNTMRFSVRVPWTYIRTGREVKVHVHPAASRQVDIIIDIYYVDINDNPTDPGPFRLRVKGRGIDLNADGDHDIVIHAPDWQLSGVGGSRSGDMIDLRGATHLWGPRSPRGVLGVGVAGYEGDDRIWGTSLADTIGGDEGNDAIWGMGGSDHLSSDSGRGYVDGGPGNDQIGGGSMPDRLLGGSGNDQIAGGGSNDQLWGGSGADTLLGNQGNDWLNGGPGNDGIIDHFGANTAIGGYGNDYINFGTLDSHPFAAKNGWAWCGPGRDVTGGKYPHRNSCEKSYT